MTVKQLLKLKIRIEEDHIKFVPKGYEYSYVLAVWKMNTKDYAESVYKLNNSLQYERITEWRQIRS